MVHSHQDFSERLRLGHAALAEGNASLALEWWRSCLECQPIPPDDLRRLALCFRSIGQLSHARSLIDSALASSPGNVVLLSDLANLQLDSGNAATAVENLLQLARTSGTSGDQALTLALLGNALMAMEYSHRHTPDDKRCVAADWAAIAEGWAASQIRRCPGAPKRRPSSGLPPLRVGFLSGDFCDHPVGFLVRPVLQHRNPKLWQPFLYDNDSRQDATFRQIFACTQEGQYRDIGSMSDCALMQQILEDELDVLIDLSGHSGKSRLRIMAYRLADKQLSWLGFSGTTGLATMDGIILDSTLAKGAAEQFCEPILALDPSRFCFNPPFAPPMASPPCLVNGYVTFGCFNNTAKYNPQHLMLWCRILHQTPGSRLMLKWRTFADSVFCEKIHRLFAESGISPERIILSDFSPHRQMLDAYNGCDIALDTFPFCGGYTSLEALWMGLPLVTMAGETPISRQSASFLQMLGRPSWIATDADAFVAVAVGLASQPELLQEVRERQRFEMMDSDLYQAERFTQQFERLMRSLIAQ